MRAGQETGGSPVGAGLLVSLLAFLAALYLLHRLACLDIGPERAGLAITLMAFAPSPSSSRPSIPSRCSSR
ncbi:MAG: hypothetical protein ACR2NH_09390 [Solirubrobacteraceae bacterium]